MDNHDDEFAGQGGSYMLDPVTGKRTLAERTHDPVFAPAPKPDAPADADAGE